MYTILPRLELVHCAVDIHLSPVIIAVVSAVDVCHTSKVRAFLFHLLIKQLRVLVEQNGFP